MTMLCLAGYEKGHEFLREAVRPHVTQLGREGGGRRRRRCVQNHRHRPRDFQVARERLAGVDQHVLALLDLALIEDAGLQPERHRLGGGRDVEGDHEVVDELDLARGAELPKIETRVGKSRHHALGFLGRLRIASEIDPVSYTPLTLPTIFSV